MDFNIFGVADEGAVDQLHEVMKDERAIQGALMADHHLGYGMPIGGVVSYADAVSPTGVGFDIGCGNKAVLTSLTVDDLPTDTLQKIMLEIQRAISFGVGRSNNTPVDHAVLDSTILRAFDRQHAKGIHQKAAAQLGTVGAGNHYVDLLADEDDRVWVANHFGSRGLGHTIATHFIKAAGATDGENAVLDTGTELGDWYLACMELAGEYAYAGRDIVADQVLGILGVDGDYEVHSHHNYAWYEDGLWVVRKGATPITRELAYIGGSMGDGAVIVRGTGEDVGALGSGPHGAGRAMSRSKAAGKLRKFWVCSNRDCDLKVRPEGGNKQPGPCACGNKKRRKVRIRDTEDAAINWTEVKADLRSRGIVVLGGDADEAPGAYKNLDEVLSAHSNIEVVHRLRPLGVVMAGADTFDPYKD